ncbi:MAG: extracellular solute-binding protein family 1 [Rhizobacter sp.]|nr:extracellular solute-binding protein family 1 [Rhizobacter sp.]
MQEPMNKSVPFELVAALTVAAAMSGPAGAQTFTHLQIVHPTPIVTPSDSIYEYAVPRKLGYFKQEGLEASFDHSAGVVASAQALQSGSADFAVTNPEVIMQMREQGSDLVGIMTLKLDNGVIMAVMDDSPIKGLDDLRGKTIGGMSFGGGGGLLLTKLLAKKGMGPGDYSRVVTGVGGGAATALRTHKVDAMILWDSAFATFENAGLKLRYIRVPGEENMAGQLLATTERFIKKNPKAIEGVCRAIAKSLYFTRLDPAATMPIFLDAFPESIPSGADRAAVARDYTHVLKSYLKAGFKDTPLDARVGGFNEANWTFTKAFYVDAGMLKGTQPVTQAYTTQFLDQCNDFDRKAVEADLQKYKAQSR